MDPYKLPRLSWSVLDRTEPILNHVLNNLKIKKEGIQSNLHLKLFDYINIIRTILIETIINSNFKP